MSTLSSVNVGQNVLFKSGWIILLLSAALMSLNHVGLIFFLDDPVLFLGWSAFNLYSLAVIAIPFRRLEKWAWVTSWLLPVCLAAGAFADPAISLFYYATAAACVLGLVLTARDFFAAGR